MNRLKSIGVFIIASILQFSVISRIEIFGISGNIFIPITVALTLGFGIFKGSYMGLAFGLLEDLLFSKILGLRALIYFSLAYLIGLRGYDFNVKDEKTGALLTGIFTLIVNIIFLIISYFTGKPMGVYLAIKMLVGEFIINSLLYFVVIKIFRKIFVFPDIVFYR